MIRFCGIEDSLWQHKIIRNTNQVETVQQRTNNLILKNHETTYIFIFFQIFVATVQKTLEVNKAIKFE